MLNESDLDYKPLLSILSKYNYALGLSPGFFQYYSLLGILTCLEDNQCIHNITHVSGSSAGALITGIYASGYSPLDIINILLSIKREDIWDIGGYCGLLKGELFHNILKSYLKVNNIEECKIPLGITAYDIIRFKTNCIYKGCLATAIRASCTFPGLFQPVIIDNIPHIDGGVFDDSGLMALPGIPDSNLIVNIVCGEGRLASSKHPTQFPNALLLTIVVRNIPTVSPFTMSTAGPLAFRLSREATLRALTHSKVIPIGPNHWVSHIDGHIFHTIPSSITIKHHHHNHHDNHDNNDQNDNQDANNNNNNNNNNKREHNEIETNNQIQDNQNISIQQEHKPKKHKKVSIGPIEEVTEKSTNLLNSSHKHSLGYRLAKLRKNKVHKKFY